MGLMSETWTKITSRFADQQGIFDFFSIEGLVQCNLLSKPNEALFFAQIPHFIAHNWKSVELAKVKIKKKNLTWKCTIICL